MDFLGVGPLELIFIFILVLIIFGPNDIVRAGKSLGRFLRKVVTSDGWKAFQQTRKGMGDIPTMLMREAGLEEEDLRKLSGMDDFEDATKVIQNQISPWTTPPSSGSNYAGNPTGEPSIEGSSQPTTGKEIQDPEQRMAAESEESPAPPPGSPFSQTIDDNNS
jgi:Sec-independent protein translocase protein TatA